MTSNAEIALLLKKVGAVFRIKEGDSFHSRAFFNASSSISSLTFPISDYQSQSKALSIPGVGVKISKYINEYLSTGRVKRFDILFKSMPAGMFGLMEIRGFGPITSYKMAKFFHLKSDKTAVDDLKRELKNAKKLPHGLTETGKKRLLLFLKQKRITKDRMLLSEAVSIANKFISYLKSQGEIIECNALGSIRRQLPSVGDIDIGFSSKNITLALEKALKYQDISEVIETGDQEARVRLNNSIEVDLKSVNSEDWGSLLQHYTGSKFHNIKLRQLAQKQGYSLSENGISNGSEVKHFQDEKAFYHFLNLSFIPPEIREDTGEIELAEKGTKFNLVRQSDIKGDLHIHSNLLQNTSHDTGTSSLQELINKALSLGYEYIALTDHNPKQGQEEVVLNLLEARKARICSYEKLVKNRGIKLFNSLEVDIKPNGELALPEDALGLLDFAIVSIHSQLTDSRSENTQRILSGLRHPKVKVLGHPTGRKINQHEGILADWALIFEYCAKKHKIIEINATPLRMDLPYELIREAARAGVKFSINSDSHHITQLDNICWGVSQARKGWLEADSVINTLSARNLIGMLNLSS